MTQLDLLISKFQLYGGRLNTTHFTTDPQLAAEYRRLLCELRKKPGFTVAKRRLNAHVFEYTLMRFVAEDSGQLRFVA